MALTLFSCSKDPDKVVSISPAHFTVEDQLKIGNTFHDAMLANPDYFSILSKSEYPAAHNYLNTLCQSLLFTSQVTRRNAYEWSFNILQDDEMEAAFFLPGGHLYITTGLLKYAENESQLFAILAHEIYYVETDAMIQAMKEEYSATLLGDILLDNPIEDLPELSEKMMHVVIEETHVYHADAYAIDLICPFQYHAASLQMLLAKAMSGHESERPLWLYCRAGNPKDRQSHIANLAESCGIEGITNAETYLDFKLNMLP